MNEFGVSPNIVQVIVAGNLVEPFSKDGSDGFDIEQSITPADQELLAAPQR